MFTARAFCTVLLSAAAIAWASAEPTQEAAARSRSCSGPMAPFAQAPILNFTTVFPGTEAAIPAADPAPAQSADGPANQASTGFEHGTCRPVIDWGPMDTSSLPIGRGST
jgi:hypothetical protein